MSTYNIGGNAEKANLEVVHTLCRILVELRPGRDYAAQISFVRIALATTAATRSMSSKIRSELGWTPRETFESGLARTVRWYLDHTAWLQAVSSGEYHKWISLNYTGEPA